MRIQIEISAEDSQELIILKDKTGINTWKELFANALTILDWVVKEVEKGRIIGSVSEEKKTYKELVMPCLNRVRKVSNNKHKEVES